MLYVVPKCRPLQTPVFYELYLVYDIGNSVIGYDNISHISMSFFFDNSNSHVECEFRESWTCHRFLILSVFIVVVFIILHAQFFFDLE